MNPLLAQAPPEPDLTRPIAVVAVAAVVIIVTVLIQVVTARRVGRPAPPEDLQAWQETSGRLLDRWMDGVEGELETRRTAPFPDTVSPTEDPRGFDEAVAGCPNLVLADDIAQLRSTAATLLARARSGDPIGPEVAEAEAAYLRARESAERHLREATTPPAPQ